MNSLTEQLKKRELSDGFYWVEFQDGEILPTTFSNQHGFICCDSLCDEENIKQILAEMPSYDGYMTVIRAYNDVVDENTKLKKLLKRTRKYLSEQETPYSLIKRLDQVFGEEK